MSTYELTPEQQIRQRYAWFQEAQRLGNVTLACLRLGISRKSFYKWKNRLAQAKKDRSTLLDGKGGVKRRRGRSRTETPGLKIQGFDVSRQVICPLFVLFFCVWTLS
jgi:hypothetical protein